MKTPIPLLALFSTLPLTGAPLTWNDGDANAFWDNVSTNWSGSVWNSATPDSAIFGATAAGTVTVNEAITVADISISADGYEIAGASDLTLSSPSTITADNDAIISVPMVGGGSVVKAGTGVLTIPTRKTYTGGTEVSGGILDLTGGGGATGTINGTLTVGSGATVRLSTGDATGWNAANPHVGVMNINGGTVNVNTTSNQTFANMAITMTGGTISGIAGSNFDFFTGASSLTTLASAETATVSMNARLRQPDATTTFTVADGDAAVDLLWSGQLNQNAGTNHFAKTGDGHMDLTGAGTWSGTTTLDGGSLRIANQLRNSASITANAGTTLEFGATNIFVAGHGAAMADSRVITVNGGTLLMNGSFDSRFGNVTLNDGAIWTSNRALAAWDALLADTDVGAATVTVAGSAAATMNGSGGIHLQGVQNFAVADVTGDDAVDLSVSMRLANPGNVGGTGGLNKTGVGTMLLNNNGNYFNGDLTVSEGTVVTGTAQGGGTNGHLGLVANSRTITVNSGAVLDFRANNQFGGSGKSAAVIPAIVVDGGTLTSTRFNILGDVTLNDGATLTQSTTDNGNYDGYEFLGPVTVGGSSASTISTGNGSANHLGAGIISFDVADVSGDAVTDLTVSAPLRDASGDYGLGAGGVSKDGLGTMEVTGGFSYTGETRVLGGTLSLATADLDDNSIVRISSGAVLDLPHGAIDSVARLFINGVAQVPGIYGAAGTVIPEITGTGSLEVTADLDTYDAWLAEYPGASGFDTDDDGDGIPNGVEHVLGTNPLVFSQGVTDVSGTAGSVSFEHTLTDALATDVTYVHEWSTDLMEWRIDAGPNTGGTTVMITTTPSPGVVAVSIAITGGPDQVLFGRLAAVQTAP